MKTITSLAFITILAIGTSSPAAAACKDPFAENSKGVELQVCDETATPKTIKCIRFEGFRICNGDPGDAATQPKPKVKVCTHDWRGRERCQ